jgi:hypothetical protein
MVVNPYLHPVSCIDMIRHYGDLYLHSDLFVTSFRDLSESDYDLGEMLDVFIFQDINQFHHYDGLSFNDLLNLRYNHLKREIDMSSVIDSVRGAKLARALSFSLSNLLDIALYISRHKPVDSVYVVSFVNKTLQPYNFHHSGYEYFAGYDYLPSVVIEFANHLYSLWHPDFFEFKMHIVSCDGDLYISDITCSNI